MKINIHKTFSTSESYIKFSKIWSNIDDTTSIWRITKVRKQHLHYCFGTIIISNETFFCGFILTNKSFDEGWIGLCKTKHEYIKIVIKFSKPIQWGLWFPNTFELPHSNGYYNISHYRLKYDSVETLALLIM